MNGNGNGRFEVGQPVWVELTCLEDCAYMWKRGVIVSMDRHWVESAKFGDPSGEKEIIQGIEYEVRWDESTEHYTFFDLGVTMASDKDFPTVSREAIQRFIKGTRADYEEQIAALKRRGLWQEPEKRKRRRRPR